MIVEFHCDFHVVASYPACNEYSIYIHLKPHQAVVFIYDMTSSNRYYSRYKAFDNYMMLSSVDIILYSFRKKTMH